MLLKNPPQHLTLGFTSFTSGAKTGYLCIPEGKGRKCVSVTSSVSLLGFKPIHIFITQAKADCNTVHTVAFSTQSEPRGVTLFVSGFPANVQLLRSASPGVLHDCSFKRSNLILYITQRAKGRSSQRRGTLGKQDAELLWRRRGEKLIYCFQPTAGL